MVNATSSPTCNKCKATDHTTQNCKSKHCSLQETPQPGGEADPEGQPQEEDP